MNPSRRSLVAAAVAAAILYALFSVAVALRWLDASDLALHSWIVKHVGPTVLGMRWSALTVVGSGAVSTAAVAGAAFLAWRSGAARTAAVIVVVAMASGVLVETFKGMHDRPYPSGGRYTVVPPGNGTACPELGRCDFRLGGNASAYCPPGSRCSFYVVNGTEEKRFNATFLPFDPGTFPTRPGRAYPSGHTMGATASWGIALLLGTRAVQRRRSLDPWALGAAAAIALIGGISRMPVHAHWWTDIVGSWLLGIAVVALAILLDDLWQRPQDPPEAPWRLRM